MRMTRNLKIKTKDELIEIVNHLNGKIESAEDLNHQIAFLKKEVRSRENQVNILTGKVQVLRELVTDKFRDALCCDD